MQISVCICTCRRPLLADCIASVVNQVGLSGSDVEIVVADDDPMFSAREIVQSARSNTTSSIRYVEVGSENIAICRNACLTAARHDWIAFIDDDEIARPDWLSSFVRACAQHPCQVVKGTVRGVYPAGTAPWIVAADPFGFTYGTTGRELKTCGGGNVFFDRSFVQANHIQFDAQLGRSGGEDSVFFSTIYRAGGKLISCNEAQVDEIVPAERLSWRSLKRRFRRYGRIHGRYFIAKRSFPEKQRGIARSIVMIVLGAGYPLVDLFDRRLALKMFLKLWVHVGIVEALLGATMLWYDG